MAVPEITVVLPAYNEGPFIRDSLRTLSSYLNGVCLPYEIVIVNDGSTDDTIKYLAEIKSNRIMACTLTTNQGKGAAIKRGIAAARGKFIIVTDADIPYGPKSIVECYKALEDGAVVAIGDRTLPQSRICVPVSLTRRLISSVYTALLKLFLHKTEIRDSQCGLKGYSLDFAKLLLSYSRVNRFMFDLEPIVFALENRIHIARVPVELVRYRTSSVRIFQDCLESLRDFFRILWFKWRGHYCMAIAKAASERERNCGSQARTAQGDSER